MDGSHVTPARDGDGLDGSGPLRDAMRYWERRRIVFNAILLAIFVGWIVLTWPHFSDAPAGQALLFLAIFFAMANILYSAAYLVDIPLQQSPARTFWRRWRLGLWLIGTLFAVLFTNYWIADEIYPYVH